MKATIFFKMHEQALERVDDLSNFFFLLCVIVFILGTVVVVFWKKSIEDKKAHKLEIEAKDKAFAKVITSYSKKLEDLNEDVRNALIANSSAIISFTSTVNELRGDVKDLKK